MSKTIEELAKEYVIEKYFKYVKRQEDDNYELLVEDFIAGYQAAAPQWISVKDRLPEWDDEAMSVLISGNSWHDYDVAYFGPTTWHDKYDDVVKGVTHWMPLPKPPEEK